MTRTVTIKAESLNIFLQATRRDLLTINVALCNASDAVTEGERTAQRIKAIKVNRHRIERVRRILDSLKIGENLTNYDLRGEGDGK